MTKILILALPLIVLLGCGSTASLIQKDDRESLAKSTDLYYKLIMWKYYDKAARFVDSESMDDYEDFVTRNEKDLNITNYEIKEVVYIDPALGESTEDNKKSKESIVRVLFTYYKYPSVSEKTVTIQDTWFQKGKVWYVISDYEEGVFE